MRLSARDTPLCRFVRVLVDGEDVTDRCYEADTSKGRVDLFLVNQEGRKYIDPKDWPPRLASKVRIGRVELKVRPLPEVLRIAWGHFLYLRPWGRTT